MDCEQVFTILTRGPFPSGDPTDRAVERHLCRCAECRRLADALRPAVELFREALTGADARDLPGYWGELGAQQHGAEGISATLVRHLPAALQQPAVRGSRWLAGRSSSSALRLLAALLVGMALGVVLWTAGVEDSNEEPLIHDVGTAKSESDTP